MHRKILAIAAIVVGVASLTAFAALAPRKPAPRPGAPKVAPRPGTPGAARSAPGAKPAPGQPAVAKTRPGAPAVVAKPKSPVPVAAAAQWPQWRGPERTGISKETGLLKTWGPEGLALVWKATGLGGGYSTPSVAGGRIYGMGAVNDQETVWALDEKTGKEIWNSVIVPANRLIGYSEGPRSTPTIDGDRLYAIGVGGDLVCLNAVTGKLNWKKNLVTEFGGTVPHWGYSESPLVDGEKLIVTPGGSTATLVALNKLDGNVLWKAQVPGDFNAHYASAIVAEPHGVRQYIQFLSAGMVGVAAKDGRFLWKYERHAGLTANIDTPIYKDNHVLISAGYGSGTGLVKLDPAPDGTFTATEVYYTQDLQNKHGGMVLVGNHVYGFDDPGELMCIEFLTGRLVWRDRSVSGNASVTYADGHLYCRSQRGEVALVAATPEGYQEKGRFEQPERSKAASWPHPVVVNGKLFLRDQDIMLCYDLKKAPPPAPAAPAAPKP